MVFVSETFAARTHEAVAWHFAHRCQHGGRLDVPRFDLSLDHRLSSCRERICDRRRTVRGSGSSRLGSTPGGQEASAEQAGGGRYSHADHSPIVSHISRLTSTPLGKCSAKSARRRGASSTMYRSTAC